MEEGILNILQQLVDFVKTASPELWRISMQQVRADVVGNWVLVGGFGVLFILLGFLTVARMDEDEIASGSAGFGAVLCLVVLVLVLVRNIKMNINPEYYAIQILIGMIPK